MNHPTDSDLNKEWLTGGKGKLPSRKVPKNSITLGAQVGRSHHAVIRHDPIQDEQVPCAVYIIRQKNANQENIITIKFFVAPKTRAASRVPLH